jgi:hypothetical protein
MRSFLFQKNAFDKEAANYDDLFSALVAAEPGIASKVKQRIQWAKTQLKKQDRITWYLRWARIELANIARTMGGENQETVEKLFKRYMVVAMNNSSATEADILEDVTPWKRIQEGLEHLYSLGIQGIDNYSPGFGLPGALMDHLERIEEEAIEKARGGDNTIEPEEDDEIVLDLGGGWAWWKLDRASCAEESRAMGHCGNAPQQGNRDMQILSLRKVKRVGKQEFWEPHLTFILIKGGTLGEMKGKGNAKPTENYHPAIVALLSQPWIKALQGGGYMPEHNFQWDDLDRDDQKKVMEANPGLETDPFFSYYKTGKVTQDQIDLIKDTHQLGYDEEVGFYTNEWKNSINMLWYLGDSEVRKMAEGYDSDINGRQDMIEEAMAKVGDGDRVLKNIVQSFINEYPYLNSKLHDIDTTKVQVVTDLITYMSDHYPDSDTINKILSATVPDATVIIEQERKWRDNIGGSGYLEEADDGKWYLVVDTGEAIENITEDYGPLNVEWPVISMAPGLFGDSIQIAFEHPLPAPKNDEQLQHYAEPTTDEEAQRDGIKISKRAVLLRKRR